MAPDSFPIPTHADQYAFLQRLYFGADRDALMACVRRAYRDLNRTLHGVARLSDSHKLADRAAVTVRALATDLAASCADNQAMFDAWHHDACLRLCALYADSGFPSFSVGQAQKWLNMVFKYVHVFGEDRLPGYERLYGFGHVPLDNIMLSQLRRYGAPQLSGAWSRIRDYGEYMRFQEWMRHRFPGSAPLAVEFGLWLTAEA